MKCISFQDQLAEYAAGRLPGNLAAAMEAHCRACAACARAEAEERRLRARFRAAPPPAASPDLWPRIAARLEAPAPPRPFWPRAFALGGATVVLAACAALFLSRAQEEYAGVPVVPVMEEQRVVERLTEMRYMPMAEGDTLRQETRAFRDEERFYLLGYSGESNR